MVASSSAMAADLDLFELALADLMTIQVATVTDAAIYQSPAATSVITAQDIQISNARSLNELLEIYVPGLQWIKHHFGFSHLGTRGVMSDRDDKYLLLINGRVMNQRTIAGAISERDLVMLSDIKRIEVIRGPGSAMYGLGAVSMVVSVTTFNGQRDSHSVTKAGMGEDYISQEFSFSGELDNGFQSYFYAAISDYQGADEKDAPVRFSTDFTSKWGDSINAGNDALVGFSADQEQYHQRLPVKLHWQLNRDTFELWARYTRGGENVAAFTENIAAPPVGRPLDVDSRYPPVELGYQQFTLDSSWQQALNQQWRLEHNIGYQFTDYERLISLEPASLGGPRVEAHAEDEVQLKSYLRNASSRHQLAFGFEWSHQRFGLKSPGYPDQPASSATFLTDMPQWHADVWSLVGEYQWTVNPQLKAYFSGRADKHTYSDWLFSPRFALVKSIDSNYLKLILSRSQRMNFDSELRLAHEANNSHTDPETLNAVELRWEHVFDQGWFAVSWFQYELDVIGFKSVNGAGNSTVIAEQKQWGLEAEWVRRTANWQFSLSHAHTKLLSFKLLDGDFSLISNAPNGFDENLNNWSHDITKAVINHRINSQWSVYSSIIYYWGFDGIKDWTDWFDGRLAPQAQQRDNDQTDIYAPNLYWNTGVRWTQSENLTWVLTGHNLAGLFEDTLNKRNFLAEASAYRLQAPSVSLQLDWAF